MKGCDSTRAPPPLEAGRFNARHRPSPLRALLSYNISFARPSQLFRTFTGLLSLFVPLVVGQITHPSRPHYRAS